jgi:hypothetical protein
MENGSYNVNFTQKCVLESGYVTEGRYLGEMLLKCLMWHSVYTKFHNDRFRNSGNRKVITTEILETAMLVLLMGGICEELC